MAFADLVKQQEPQKDSRLFNYEESSPENRNKGFQSASKSSDWDAIDKTLLAGYEATNASDWGQTQQISRNPEQFFEQKFPVGSANLVGSHPSRDQVNALMGGNALAVPAIADQLSSGWRKALLGALLAAKAVTVNNNQKIGLDAVRW